MAIASPEFLVEVLDQEQDLRKSPAHTPLWYTAKLDSWNCTVDPNSTQPLPLAADWLQVICGGARQMLQSTAMPSTELKGTAAAMLPRPLDGAWRRILDSKIPRQGSIQVAADLHRPECCSFGRHFGPLTRRLCWEHGPWPFRFACLRCCCWKYRGGHSWWLGRLPLQGLPSRSDRDFLPAMIALVHRTCQSRAAITSRMPAPSTIEASTLQQPPVLLKQELGQGGATWTDVCVQPPKRCTVPAGSPSSSE